MKNSDLYLGGQTSCQMKKLLLVLTSGASLIWFWPACIVFMNRHRYMQLFQPSALLFLTIRLSWIRNRPRSLFGMNLLSSPISGIRGVTNASDCGFRCTLLIELKDVPGGFPKSDLLGVTVALIHVVGQQFLAV